MADFAQALAKVREFASGDPTRRIGGLEALSRGRDSWEIQALLEQEGVTQDLVRAAVDVNGDLLNFFTTACLGTIGVSTVCLILCGWYFAARVPVVAEAPA